MTQSNSSDSTSGAEHSAFRSAQSALARKPLPGPPWAWPGVAVLAIAGVAYLVVGTSGEHAAVRAAPSPSTEIAQLEAANRAPATAAATEPPVAAPSNPPAPPAAAPANDIAAAPPKAAEAEPAKAGDTEQAVASTSAVSKKKARGSANRNRKRSTRAQ